MRWCSKSGVHFTLSNAILYRSYTVDVSECSPPATSSRPTEAAPVCMVSLPCLDPLPGYMSSIHGHVAANESREGLGH